MSTRPTIRSVEQRNGCARGANSGCGCGSEGDVVGLEAGDSATGNNGAVARERYISRMIGGVANVDVIVSKSYGA